MLQFPAKGPIARNAQKSSELGIYEDRAESAKIKAAAERRSEKEAARREILKKKGEAKRATKEDEPETMSIGGVSARFRRRKK